MKYYKIIFLSFITILFSHTDGDHNHSHSMKNKGIILGVVIDKDTNSPIEYVSVSIESIESKTIVSGAISDENGYFYVDKLAIGDYQVNVEYIGYEK